MTQIEMVKRILARLGVLAAGETPSAEDATIVKEALLATLAELEIDGLTVGIDPDDFAPWTQNIIRDLVMYEVGPFFGIAVPIDLQTAALNRLKKQQGSQYADAEILKIQRF